MTENEASAAPAPDKTPDLESTGIAGTMSSVPAGPSSEKIDDATLDRFLPRTSPVAAEANTDVGKPEDAAPVGSETTEAPGRPHLRRDDLDYQDARLVLRREGWRDKAIDALDRDEVLEIAETRRRVRSDHDKLSGELSRLATQRPAPERQKAQEGQEPTPQPTLDLGKLEGLLKNEVMGEAGQELISVLRALGGARQQTDTSEVNGLRTVVRELMESNARKELDVVFPDAVDDKTYEIIRRRATNQLRAGEYDSIAEAMKSEARSLLYDKHVKAKRDTDARLSDARKNGSPHKPAPARAPAKTVSDKDDVALDAIFGNKPDAARAAYS